MSSQGAIQVKSLIAGLSLSILGLPMAKMEQKVLTFILKI